MKSVCITLLTIVGMVYTQLRLLRASDQKKRHDIYLLQVDRTNPMALRQLKFALKDPKKNTSYRMQVQVATKYLHWQEETALYPISQDASNLTVKVLHNGNMYIRCTGGVSTPLGVKIK